MQVVPVQLGFSVADGERVDVSFADGDLALRFVDWREQIVEARFLETLAFRWASRPSLETPRDDSTFEVVDSVWLQDEVRLDEPTNPEDFAHYVLCFNAEKVLEIVCRRQLR